jgi:hypothetical protein
LEERVLFQGVLQGKKLSGTCRSSSSSHRWTCSGSTEKSPLYSGICRALSVGVGPEEGCCQAAVGGEWTRWQRVKCPRRMKCILPGRPQGVATSHGTKATYRRSGLARQGPVAGMAGLPPQGVWADVSSPPMEPTLLPRPGVPGVGASLASDEAATTASRGGRGASEARGGRTSPAAARSSQQAVTWG